MPRIVLRQELTLALSSMCSTLLAILRKVLSSFTKTNVSLTFSTRSLELSPALNSFLM